METRHDKTLTVKKLYGRKVQCDILREDKRVISEGEWFWRPVAQRLCNSRLLRSHMRLKKNRPYNHWLKSQGHYLLCFSTSKTVGANSVRLRHETRTRYSLKATTKISPTLENKNVPILRSRNIQNTRTPLKTGSEQSVKLLFIGQWNFDPFQMDQPKTRLISI